MREIPTIILHDYHSLIRFVDIEKCTVPCAGPIEKGVAEEDDVDSEDDNDYDDFDLSCTSSNSAAIANPRLPEVQTQSI